MEVVVDSAGKEFVHEVEESGVEREDDEATAVDNGVKGGTDNHVGREAGRDFVECD